MNPYSVALVVDASLHSLALHDCVYVSVVDCFVVVVIDLSDVTEKVFVEVVLDVSLCS